MAKTIEHAMLLPPRYRRGDPRNLDRMKAGQALGMRIQGYNRNVRKLRKRGGSYSVTIPAWLISELGFEEGDDIMFGKADVPAVLVLTAVKRTGDRGGGRQGG